MGQLVRLREPDVRVSPEETYDFAGVYCFGRGLFKGQRRRGSEFSYRVLTRLCPGDLVYPKLMAWEGAFGVVPAEMDGLVVSPEFPVFSVDRERVLPEFLDLYFRSPSVWPLLGERSTGTNVRRRRLQPSAFLSFEIGLPPLVEQQRIVARIARIGAGLAQIREESHRAHRDAQHLIHAAFARVIAGAGLGRMGDAAPLVRRAVMVRDGVLYPELGIRSFGKGAFHKPPLDALSVGTKQLYRIESGDLVFSNVFAWEGAIAVARPEDSGRCGSHRFITCVAQEGVATAEFLRFYFLTKEGLAKIGVASPGGAGRNRTLGLAKLAEIEVPLPAYERQIWFDRLQAKVCKMMEICAEAEHDIDAIEGAMVCRSLGECSY